MYDLTRYFMCTQVIFLFFYRLSQYKTGIAHFLLISILSITKCAFYNSGDLMACSVSNNASEKTIQPSEAMLFARTICTYIGFRALISFLFPLY
jgi:hypothetical protein